MAAHLAVSLVISDNTNIRTSPGFGQLTEKEKDAKAISVRFVKPGDIATSSITIPPLSPEVPSAPEIPSLNISGDRAQGPDMPSVTSIQRQAAPYYFKVRELTQKPLIAYDTASDEMLIVPDLSPQPVIVRLLINERGFVDQVLVEESSLSKEGEQVIANAFVFLRFHPGKIGDQPVKSQLAIEVILQNDLSSAPSVTEPRVLEKDTI